jgi:vitamin B12/bleomycin/antimicrobial peptide transport system ATP-binding/permease protein
VRRFISKLAIIWRLASPYFRSEDRWAGGGLLGIIVALELALVFIDVQINHWNNRFYNALQDRDWDAFVSELTYFGLLAGAFILLAVYKLYLNQWLQIRWRRWLTQYYLERWLNTANHYRMQLLGDAADNPDQRIAEDVKKFIDGENGSGVLPIGLGFLSSVVTLASFVFILWGLSAEAPISIFGMQIPGYLVWAALLYAVVGTLLTHLIGRALVRLNFMQQRYEADFRFNLVRVRENSEQIGLLEGEKAETERLLDRFGWVVTNWYGIMTRTKRLTFFTAGYNQTAIIFPYIVTSPAYFSGLMQLGGMMQTASAFDSVRGALSFFITAYRDLAEWASVIDRLDGFDKAATAAQAAAVTPPVIELRSEPGKRSLDIDNLSIRLPNDQPLVEADGISIKAGDRVLLTGPSGSGKSTLFRAIAGIWPFGSGTISVPTEAEVMLLPQRPYFPVARLSSAIAYPAEPGTFDNETIKAALNAVGLPAMAERLEEEAHWNRMLSLGEQQRLGVARALLHAPDYLFLDEATASLDEASEAAVYRLLQERLPRTTIVSIGHRSTLADFHTRRLSLVRDGDRHHLRETLLEVAAQ